MVPPGEVTILVVDDEEALCNLLQISLHRQGYRVNVAHNGREALEVVAVTKIDLVSQAEREVFRARIKDAAPAVRIREVNALYGIGIDPIVAHVLQTPDVTDQLMLRGNPPVGTCTICVGKKEIGWQSHFGVVRALENQNFYRGE